MRYLLLALVSFSFTACRFLGEEVDMIVHNARIYTVNANFDMAEAMAIKDGKIIAIGAEREILNKYTSNRMVDCGKRCVYPGFIDAHCHFLAYGHTLQEANLVGTKTWAEVIEAVKKQAEKKKEGWIIGRGWDQNDWEDKSFPTCAELDALFPERPVYLTRIDGHAALVNSAAMKLAGIGPATTITGGTVLTQDGVCTGLLIDKAMDFIEKILPARTKAEKVDALLQAQAKCFEMGLTTVDEAGLLKADIDLIDSLQRAGSLQMRVYAMLSDVPSNYDYYLEKGIDTTSQSLTVRAFKFYADGALGSRGACLLSPYDDLLAANRVEYGFLLDTINHYRVRYAQLHSKGFQVCTHAIGDSANRVVLGMYKEFLGGSNDLRWRIEHAQVVDSADISMFAQYNIIPSVQPTHATSDMPWAQARLGRNRVRRAYAYKRLKDQLGMLALGTDFPVEDISPFATFRAAVYRVAADGMPTGGWQSENALSKEDALRGMTIWAAISNFEDHRKGSLEVGKLADFVILQKDLMEVGAKELTGELVKGTYVGGKEVFRRKS
jgi:predicted amidohydrolase YtcJ